ncbi:MAG: glutamate 5-kinase [Rhodospirillales bacterium]|jgi:glutamate 5-kinase|nr:glutamate 5-kinase [Rhodospirillaceae bacterium]MDP6426667.1 glutamate 5-kinase [Rhodospirillales bacterium]MDP6645898.1 glutamate 5-kinase [Rhodospirillales bacterium]MDP6840755.1 glutamate 5-kinase [Rhodospirillales bacterium]
MTGTHDIAGAKRVVVKVGSALLVDTDGTLHSSWLGSLARDIAGFRRRGQDVILVSSGAVALGRRYLGLKSGGLKLEEKQAAAAAGMVRLAHAYQERLGEHQLTVAQILLTLADSEDRRRYLNARSTLMTLLGVGAVPLINENDTVATDEIRFGDNDRLAARVAAMVSADLLILLSDIDGFYTADPGRHADAVLVPEITEITAEIDAMAGTSNSSDSSGGMITKLAAARACMGAGCHMVIADGRIESPLSVLEEAGHGTWFVPQASPHTARKSWIAGTLQPVGALIVDDGAAKALVGGRSLLPAGVASVEGSFERGDAVAVKTPDGAELGRGLVAYSADDARRIMGHKTDEIEALLGYRGRDEMIHRDDLAIL